MKNGKRIHSVTIKREIDDSPDTSYLGEYSSKPTSEFSIDRAHTLECAINTHEVTPVCPSCGTSFGINLGRKVNDECPECHDAVLEPEELCNCGERGDMGRNEYRYFNPSFNYVDKAGHATDGNSPADVRKYVAQDYASMEALNAGDWCYLMIGADAEITVDEVVQHIGSGWIGGIESNSDESYLKENEQNQLSQLKSQLHALGFSKRAISAAFKGVSNG